MVVDMSNSTFVPAHYDMYSPYTSVYHIDTSETKIREQSLVVNNHDDIKSHSSYDKYSFATHLSSEAIEIRNRPRRYRNAWGNLSYANLIAAAILSSPKKRMKLSEIYSWFVNNIPYFSLREDDNKSKGWKNSIRHNLSLKKEFRRESGEKKAGFWTVNEETFYDRLRMENRQINDPYYNRDMEMFEIYVTKFFSKHKSIKNEFSLIENINKSDSESPRKLVETLSNGSLNQNSQIIANALTIKEYSRPASSNSETPKQISISNLETITNMENTGCKTAAAEHTSDSRQIIQNSSFDSKASPSLNPTINQPTSVAYTKAVQYESNPLVLATSKSMPSTSSLLHPTSHIASSEPFLYGYNSSNDYVPVESYKYNQLSNMGYSEPYRFGHVVFGETYSNYNSVSTYQSPEMGFGNFDMIKSCSMPVLSCGSVDQNMFTLPYYSHKSNTGLQFVFHKAESSENMQPALSTNKAHHM